MCNLTMQEYKQKKDDFKRDLSRLIEKFNEETGVAIEDINISIDNEYSIRHSIQLCNAKVEMTTSIDK